MASSIVGAAPLVVGLAVRGLVAGGALWTAAWLAISRGAYMAALVLIALAALACADAVRVAGRRERLLRNFAEALASGAVERPASTNRADDGVAVAIERAAERIERDRRTLRAELDRLGALADTVRIALFILASDGRIRFSNRAAYRLLPEPGRSFSAMPAVGKELGVRLETLAPGTREVAQLADGRSVLVSSVSFATPEGEPLRLMSMQAIVGELDAVELKAWRDLSRVLAHEMMNSLAPIVSMTESLEAMLAQPERADPVQLARAVETIGRRSTGLMRFINRYRQMAELPPAQLASVPLRAFVAEIAALVEPGLATRGIRLDTRVEPAELVVQADVELLSHAVINLIKNAGEAAADAPDPRIGLTCAQGAARVEILVTDNGHGVPADTDTLFLPFYTTRVGHGGIGLAIVRQVALAHRGTISVQRLDPGTCFKLLIPLAE